MKTGDKIKALRKQNGLTQEQVGNYIGVRKAAVAKYESGIVKNIKANTLEKLSELFGVPPTYFFEFDEESKNTIPVLGRVQAGPPTSAFQDIIGWEELTPDLANNGHDYFALRVKGDSMSPVFIDGDVVIIKMQRTCENGQDCVVIVGDEDATLKRVFKEPSRLILQPLNREYSPIIIDYNESNPAMILGVVVELRRRF